MMVLKRKASSEGLTAPKRLQKQSDNLDSISEAFNSDAEDVEYSPPDSPGAMSHDMQETPATPMSTTSSRYPSELKIFHCAFEGCGKAYNRPSRLQEHIRSHNNERIFHCESEGCNKSFLRPSHLAHHVKSAHSDVREYPCDRPGCDKSFVTGSRLRRHLAAHDGRDQHRCTEYPPCNETFRKHTTLHKHVTTVHKKQKLFPCTKTDPVTGKPCQMGFDTAGNLRNHESRVHSEKRFACMECSENQSQPSGVDQTENVTSQDYSFPTYASLQEHIRTVHPPACPHCPMLCSTTRELQRHIEVAHGDFTLEDRQVFPCTFLGCDRSFTRQGNLNVHVRTVHEGEKRFVCGEADLSTSKKIQGWDGIGCGNRYGSKLSLEEHIRCHHIGLPSVKKIRRERLGLSQKPQSKKSISTVTALTGQGYVEDRQIKCFDESCPHRFHRDYDLWVHMTTKHECPEDNIENLFMQRALLADDSGSAGNSLGMYGLGFDQEGQYRHHAYTGGDSSSDIAFGSQSNDSSYLPAQPGLDSDYLMQDIPVDASANGNHSNNLDSMIPSHDEMAFIDPVLAYHLEMEE